MMRKQGCRIFLVFAQQLQYLGSRLLFADCYINGFCSGCHSDFHTRGSIDNAYPPNESSPWIRHPTDLLLPDADEFASYNPVTGYSALAPVGWEDPDTPVRAEAIVMCLSCHRPHGSPNPDMLRWSYDACQTGVDNPACGCFVCHTAKDAG